MVLESLYYSKWRHISKSRRDLDIGLTMPMSKLFSYTTMCLNFMLLDRFLYELPCKNTHGNTHTHTHTDAHKDSDEYSIVEFYKKLIAYYLYLKVKIVKISLTPVMGFNKLLTAMLNDHLIYWCLWTNMLVQHLPIE